MQPENTTSPRGTEVAHLLISKASPRRLQVLIVDCPASLRGAAERLAGAIVKLRPWPGNGTVSLFVESAGGRRWLPTPCRPGSMAYLLDWQALAERCLLVVFGRYSPPGFDKLKPWK